MIRCQRQSGHHGAEIRPANADIHNIGEWLAVMRCDATATNTFSKGAKRDAGRFNVARNRRV